MRASIGFATGNLYRRSAEILDRISCGQNHAGREYAKDGEAIHMQVNVDQCLVRCQAGLGSDAIEEREQALVEQQLHSAASIRPRVDLRQAGEQAVRADAGSYQGLDHGRGAGRC